MEPAKPHEKRSAEIDNAVLAMTRVGLEIMDLCNMTMPERLLFWKRLKEKIG